MGTIAEKLTYLNTTKDKLKDVINMTDANIDANTTFRNYAQALYDGYINVLKDRDTLLDNVPKSTSTGSISEGLGLPIYEDKMSKLSTQETTTGKNLLNKKEIVSTNTTNWEVTQTTNGVIINHKTAWESGIPILTISLKANTTYTYSQTRESGTGSVGVKSDADDSYIYVSSGSHQTTTGSEGTITLRFSSPIETTTEFSFMQLEESSTATSYEPYTYGASPNPNYPQEVKTVKGYRNLLENTSSTQEISGVKITKNADGSLYLKGTATGNIYYYINGLASTYSLSLNAGTYTLNGGLSSGVFLRLANATETYDSLGSSRTFTISNASSYYCVLRITTNTEVDTTIYPMLNEGNTPLPYVPYGTNWVYNKIIGFNIWDEEKEDGRLDITDGSNIIDNTYYRSKNYILVKANQTYYTYLGTNTSAWIGVGYYDENKTFISWHGAVVNKNAFTTPNNCKYIRFYISKTYYENICINISNDNLNGTYEAYKENIITIPLNNNEVCGIGDYKDELIVDKNGKCWLNKKIGKVVLDGTQSWTVAENNTNTTRLYTDISNIFNAGVAIDQNVYVISNKLLGVKFGTVYNDEDKEYIVSNYNQQGSTTLKRLHVRIPNSVATTSSAFKTWLSSNNITVYYVLIEPSLIDLNYNVDMTLYEGINNIINSEDMDMSIKYIKDTYE